MRLLAFSDLHRDRFAAERLVELARRADVVIGAGDFAFIHAGLADSIDVLAAIDRRTVLIPGNHESADELRQACREWPRATILHGDGTTIGGVQFFGLGAGVPPTPFSWSFDLTDEEAGGLLAPCPVGAVLVVHSPPQGHLDRAGGRSLGSAAILETIQRAAPVLAVCGHIHEAWGQEVTIGSTRVANVGPQGRFFEL